MNRCKTDDTQNPESLILYESMQDANASMHTELNLFSKKQEMVCIDGKGFVSMQTEVNPNS